jgi:hypothetical protein
MSALLIAFFAVAHAISAIMFLRNSAPIAACVLAFGAGAEFAFLISILVLRRA